jgi:hypothetical protein
MVGLVAVVASAGAPKLKMPVRASETIAETAKDFLLWCFANIRISSFTFGALVCSLTSDD